jgi:hypothetical protein
MAYTDEFGNIFGEAEDFETTPDWENVFVNTPDNPWTAGEVFNYDWSNPSGTGFGMVKNYLSKLFKGEGSTADYGTAIAGLMGLYEQMNKDRSPKMWEGKVEKTPYVAPTVTPEFHAAVQQRPYGERVMGMDPFTFTGAVPTAAPAPTKSIFAPRPPVASTATNTTTAAPATASPAIQQAASGVSKLLLVPEKYTAAAEGGLMGFARGGKSMPPRYLRGQTDGMADKIPSNIDGVQPAKLSHGEFVIPADVVSHLGNGNSDAGAKVLYKMMDRVRHARTGNKKQGRRINPEKFTPGGIAGYAGGGAVAFNTGGGAVNPTGTGGSLTGGLSPWVGDYVAGEDGYLSKAWGLSQKPYEAYKGPLTAGLSDTQKQAIGDYGNLQVPGAMGEATKTAGDISGKFGSMSYKPVGETFGAEQAMNYMNPYLQAALNPQLEELTRQNQINQNQQMAKLAQAGAFGGSRDAIMRAENARNLGQLQSKVLSEGYATAYDKAMAQFNADQARKIGEVQYGSDFGMKALDKQLDAAQAQSNLAQTEFKTGLEGLNAQMSAGAVQQAAEKENVAAQLAQWQESQKYPYEQLKFMQSMIQGLPVSTSTTTPNTSMFADLMAGIGGLLDLYKKIPG